MPQITTSCRPCAKLLTIWAASALLAGVLIGCGGDEPSVPSTPPPQTKTSQDVEPVRPDTVNPGPEVADTKPTPPATPKVRLPELPPVLPSSQELAAEELKKIGATVEFNKNADVEFVSFQDLPITDDHLRLLKPFEFLKKLELTNTPVGDAGLQHLVNFNQLRVLVLYGTQVTNAGLVQLEHLPRLHHLCLDETQIDDAGLPHLRNLYGLEVLHLATRGRITDDGLRELHVLTNLQELKLGEQPVSDEALARLKKAVPQVEVLQGGDTGATP